MCVNKNVLIKINYIEVHLYISLSQFCYRN